MEQFLSDTDIQSLIDRTRGIGGKVYLPVGEYKLTRSLIIDTPSSVLEGEAWACNVDPNGVFESPYGTKLKLQGKDFPAITVGKSNVLSGTVIKNIGIQGDIEGMDTRGLFDINNVHASAGIFFENMRVDQAEFSKISCCGLSVAICAKGDCFVDACTFEKINTDGCCIGVYFAPKVAVFSHFRQFIVADTPSYGFYLDGTGRAIKGVDISDMILVRNCGSSPIVDEEPAAVYFKNVSNCIFRDNFVAEAGAFWYYAPDATSNEERQIHANKAIGLKIVGNVNKVLNNNFSHSSRECMSIKGNGNVIMNNTVDGDVIINGSGNVVHNLVFTSPKGKLILIGDAKHTTDIFGVSEERIYRQ